MLRFRPKAIVDTVRHPLLLLDPDLKVVLANRSFYLTFKVEPAETVWTCPHFWHKKLRLKIHRMENLSHGVIAPEVYERV